MSTLITKKPPRRTAGPAIARLHFADGRVVPFRDQRLAFALWLGLPKGTRAAFRGAADSRPVDPWDCVDAL